MKKFSNFMVKGADVISTVDRMFLRWLALRSRDASI